MPKSPNGNEAVTPKEGVRATIPPSLEFPGPSANDLYNFESSPHPVPMTSFDRIHWRATKIVATLGPSSSTPEILRQLITAGIDVARINASHGNHQEHSRLIASIRKISAKLGRPVGVLFDLQGPKIRLADFEGGFRRIERGDEIILAVGRPAEDGEIGSDYDLLDQDVKIGDPLLIDDGNVSCEVISVEAGTVVCRAENGGKLRPRKGINLPESSVSASAFTDRDREDTLFAISQGVDYIALSFVRKAADVLELKQVIEDTGARTPIISKIEKPRAIEELSEILDVSVGVMVARGDLGVEMPAPQVPVLQKQIIRESRAAGRPVITATQMLDSMTRNPRPTRAEASDVANAVLDGTDAVMLSQETAVGKYPVESVQMMADIITHTEKSIPRSLTRLRQSENAVNSTAEAVVDAACQVSHHLDAHAIVAFTRTGSTALLASQRRPQRPILAFTSSPMVRDQLTLAWGVRPYWLPSARTTDDLIKELDRVLVADDLASPGDRLVLLLGAPTYRMGSTNLMLVYPVGSWAPLEGLPPFEDEDE